jgi:hypothetical protein
LYNPRVVYFVSQRALKARVSLYNIDHEQWGVYQLMMTDDALSVPGGNGCL